jgi:hypothetical protein
MEEMTTGHKNIRLENLRDEVNQKTYLFLFGLSVLV